MAEQTGEVSIGALKRPQLSDADRIMRLAFSTFLGIEDPAQCMPGRELVRCRFEADPSGALGALRDGRLIGSNLVTTWGSFGWFGPLTVDPEFWERGIAKRLLEPTMEIFRSKGARAAGLFTFANSPKHQGLYQRFDFWPRFLTASMHKSVSPARQTRHAVRFSRLHPDERETYLSAVFDLGDAIFEGLDLRGEISAVRTHGFGDTLFLPSDSRLGGFAICHYGQPSEASRGSCYVKFAAVRPGANSATVFAQLLDAIEGLAKEERLAKIEAGVNFERIEAYRTMIGRGFRSDSYGVAMFHRNDSAYNRADVLVIDDLA